MAATPKASWALGARVAAFADDQPDAASVHAQFDRVLDAVADKLPKVGEHLDEARADVLAFTGFPKEIWRQIWSNNPSERATTTSSRLSADSNKPATRRPRS